VVAGDLAEGYERGVGDETFGLVGAGRDRRAASRPGSSVEMLGPATACGGSVAPAHADDATGRDDGDVNRQVFAIAGSRFVGRMPSVVATCRRQEINVLEYLTQCYQAHLNGQAAPSRLPASSNTHAARINLERLRHIQGDMGPAAHGMGRPCDLGPGRRSRPGRASGWVGTPERSP
jgi:hypothetical protein